MVPVASGSAPAEALSGEPRALRSGRKEGPHMSAGFHELDSVGLRLNTLHVMHDLGRKLKLHHEVREALIRPVIPEAKAICVRRRKR